MNYYNVTEFVPTMDSRLTIVMASRRENKSKLSLLEAGVGLK